LRCGLIVGPYDPTDRFTYWPLHIQHGGEILVPSPPQRQVQFIDASDLAHFILLLATKQTAGIFNTTGPAQKLTMQDFLSECITATGSQVSLTWVSEEFVTSNDIGHIPMWTPKDWQGIFEVNCSKAIDAGLSFKELKHTIKATLDWHATRASDYELKVGLKPDEESKLLGKWHNDQNK
jgi:2'-hydroxyisoflavone reductase